MGDCFGSLYVISSDHDRGYTGSCMVFDCLFDSGAKRVLNSEHGDHNEVGVNLAAVFGFNKSVMAVLKLHPLICSVVDIRDTKRSISETCIMLSRRLKIFVVKGDNAAVSCTLVRGLDFLWRALYEYPNSSIRLVEASCHVLEIRIEGSTIFELTGQHFLVFPNFKCWIRFDEEVDQGLFGWVTVELEFAGAVTNLAS